LKKSINQQTALKKLSLAEIESYAAKLRGSITFSLEVDDAVEKRAEICKRLNRKNTDKSQAHTPLIQSS
jgi:hypothetical protein